MGAPTRKVEALEAQVADLRQQVAVQQDVINSQSNQEYVDRIAELEQDNANLVDEITDLEAANVALAAERDRVDDERDEANDDTPVE